MLNLIIIVTLFITQTIYKFGEPLATGAANFPSSFTVQSSPIYQQNTTTILQPFVRDYPGEPVPQETLTHPPS